MGRTRHTRKKQKRKRTRHRRSGRGGGSILATVIDGGFKEGLVGFESHSGGKKSFPTYAISDIAPGDKRAMSSDKRKFKKFLKSLKHKKKKSRKKRKSRKHKRRRRKR